MRDPFQIIEGDCLAVLRDMEPGSVDAVVTDPPAGIGFMGKAWDRDKGGRERWIEWMAERAAAALACVPPGGHALVWALPRTSHWTATAWEDAGWEVRDRVSHLFGTGFPKSHNLDRDGGPWQGWGTALKPGMEDWWLLRKPLAGTVAANVAAHGTGALNIDACRVPVSDQDAEATRLRNGRGEKPAHWFLQGGNDGRGRSGIESGRWPANVTHDGSPEVMEAFAQFGEKASGVKSGEYEKWGTQGIYGKGGSAEAPCYGDTGTAARFYYCAKASKAEREAGLDTPAKGRANTHPTVKPAALMAYLCRLVTPPGGTVLDPFAGSGSTGVACAQEGFRFVGIEREPEYAETARQRVAHAYAEHEHAQAALPL